MKILELTEAAVPVDAVLKQQLSTKLEWARQKLSQLHGIELPPIGYRLDIKGTTGGQFVAKSLGGGQYQFYLRFNPTLINDHKEKFIERTVPHEVCHYFVTYKYSYLPYKSTGRIYRPQPHGMEWIRAMTSLGVPADTTHTYDVSNVPTRKNYINFTCGCPNTAHQLSPIRTRKHEDSLRMGGKGYSCRRCGQSLKRK